MKCPFQLALALTLCVVPLQCATLERLTLDDMIGKSTAIVRGKVTSSYAAFTDSMIYTHYAVQVSERFKGPVQNSIDVVIPGGVANNLSQSFAGAPTFNRGDEYVFFLWTSRAGLTQVLGLTQGLFSVAGDGTSDPKTTRAASRELMLDHGQPVKDQTLVMRVSELRSRIAIALAKGVSK